MSRPLGKAFLGFSIQGFSGTSFQLSSIALIYGGSPGHSPLSVAPVSITADNQTFFTETQLLDTTLASFDMAQVRVSFSIPAGLNLGTSITVEPVYQYAPNSALGSIASGADFITTAANAPVPAPLPVLGAGAAFAFSRSLRRRLG